MDRFTISLNPELATAFDAFIVERGYVNRSEAVRDLLRQAMEGQRQARDEAGQCVAMLSYVYDHHQRELAKRLTALQHEHHDLAVSTLHTHLDSDNCAECAVLKGPTAAVRRFAEALIAESGVHHGQLNLITLDASAASHEHGHRHPHPHRHDAPSATIPAIKPIQRGADRRRNV